MSTLPAAQGRYRKSASRRGFSLVETLVAITILLIAIVGPMTMAARGLQSAFYAREQITAALLAEEGVELVRALRDKSALERRNNWFTYIPPACGSSNAHGCGIDARNLELFNCAGGGGGCRLKYDETGASDRGFYTHDTGEDTLYTRRIWVNEAAGGREADITVKVSWRSGLFGSEKTVTLQSRIFDHYDTN